MRPHDAPLTSLRVAVTGHRDLDPRGHDDARRVVGEVIDDLIERSAPARVELLTGMADGADQLVTDVAIGCGCDIQVVLPKPYDEYRSELSPEGVAALDELAARPDTRVSIVVDGHDQPKARPIRPFPTAVWAFISRSRLTCSSRSGMASSNVSRAEPSTS